MPKIFKASETKYLAFLDNPEIVRSPPPPPSTPSHILTTQPIRLTTPPPSAQKPPSFQVSLCQEYHLPVGGTKTTDSKVTFERDPSSGLILKYVLALFLSLFFLY